MGFYHRQIDKALENAPVIRAKDHPKIVMCSDCHRGIGTWNDSFLQNKPLYMAALQYYRRNHFTYIELGDGDELWENRRYQDICHIHSDVFQLLTDFQTAGRLFLLWAIMTGQNPQSGSFLSPGTVFRFWRRSFPRG